MSDGWCEACWERPSLKYARGGYTYRCAECTTTPPATVTSGDEVNIEASATTVPVNRKERRYAEKRARRRR